MFSTEIKPCVLSPRKRGHRHDLPQGLTGACCCLVLMFALRTIEERLLDKRYMQKYIMQGKSTFYGPSLKLLDVHYLESVKNYELVIFQTN